MKQHFLINNKAKHLLLFFAGWGMDETPFLQFHPNDADRMICYDYRTPEFDVTLLQPYTNITLVAWSMGVWAASQTMKRYPGLTVSYSLAVNGTLYPIDEMKGIVPDIFKGTLEGLNEQTLKKFQRRMCGSATDYKDFQKVAPHRPIDELKEELAAIRKQYFSCTPSDFRFQKALIGTEDRIFSPDNQFRAWEGNVQSVEQVEAAHYRHDLFEKIFTEDVTGKDGEQQKG